MVRWNKEGTILGETDPLGEELALLLAHQCLVGRGVSWVLIDDCHQLVLHLEVDAEPVLDPHRPDHHSLGVAKVEHQLSWQSDKFELRERLVNVLVGTVD